MTRTTKADMQRAMEHLAEATGAHVAKDYKDVGGWRVDYNPIYGGAVIEEIVNNGGGVTRAFTDRRVPPDMFCHCCQFAARAIARAKH